MKVATYDNPSTGCRECWQDGQLICHYSAELLLTKPFPIPPELFFFGANIGDWKPGQIVGDKEATGQ